MIIRGWSVSSMIKFMPDRRITSCNWPRRSLMMPHLGMKMRISKPASCIFWGNSRPITDMWLSAT